MRLTRRFRQRPSQHRTALTDEELLALPLDDDDLSSKLEAASDQSRAKSTVVLAALALVVFGFAAGTATGASVTRMTLGLSNDEEHTQVVWTDESIVEGIVRMVDGTSVYVERADQSVVHVRLTSDTSRLTVQADTDDTLSQGVSLLVFGEIDEDNIWTATRIVETTAR